MIINYCIPCSTAYANSELKRIYSIAKATCIKNAVTSSLGILDNRYINLTYGYLGVFCRLYFNKTEESHLKIPVNSFIIDHSYTPKELKGSIFRLSKMNKSLETQIFNESMITSNEKDLIYKHVKEISTEKTISLLVNKTIANRVKDYNLYQEKIDILIKNSSVQERIKQSAQPLINIWKKGNTNSPKSTINCVAYKPWEMKVDTTGKHRVVNHYGERTNIDISRIGIVYCPTSMMALDFILKQCPIRISHGHPMYRILGNYIPKLSKSDAIDLLVNCIARTSFSINKMPEFNDYMNNIAD